MKLYTTKIKTPLGEMIACSTDDAICLLEFTEKTDEARSMKIKSAAEIAKLINAEIFEEENEILTSLKKQLAEYFECKRKEFDVPTLFVGTEFQKNAWSALNNIPYGQTRSYKDQATAINNPKAVRAIGSANNKNRISIVVPCHRVIGHNGKLVGYGGELWRKQWLIEFEKQNC